MFIIYDQYSAGSSSDSALCLPPPSSEDSASEAEPDSGEPLRTSAFRDQELDTASSDRNKHICLAKDPVSTFKSPSYLLLMCVLQVFTSESENSSVATCRTVLSRRVDPGTGEVVLLSPSASLSFGSNLSLTSQPNLAPEAAQAQDKPASNPAGKLATPVSRV